MFELGAAPIQIELDNGEEIEITDCYATLQKATNLYGEELDPVDIVEKGYLLGKKAKIVQSQFPQKMRE